MYPNLTYIVFRKIHEKYHLYLRLVSQVWKKVSVIIIPIKPVQKRQYRLGISWEDRLVINQKLIQLRHQHILQEKDDDEDEDDGVNYPFLYFYPSCSSGNKILIYLTINDESDESFSTGLECACKSGNFEIIELMRKLVLMKEKRKCWNAGLLEACRKGKLDIIKKMIAYGADDWYQAFDYVCQDDDLEIIQFIISKYTEISPVPSRAFWNHGLQGACVGGKMNLVEMMIANGANCWNECFRTACKYGHIEIAKLMLEKTLLKGIVKNSRDYLLLLNQGFRDACLGGTLEMVQSLIEYGAGDWNAGLFEACCGSNLEIVKLMIQKGATKSKIQECIEYKFASNKIKKYLESCIKN